MWMFNQLLLVGVLLIPKPWETWLYPRSSLWPAPYCREVFPCMEDYLQKSEYPSVHWVSNSETWSKCSPQRLSIGTHFFLTQRIMRFFARILALLDKTNATSMNSGSSVSFLPWKNCLSVCVCVWGLCAWCMYVVHTWFVYVLWHVCIYVRYVVCVHRGLAYLCPVPMSLWGGWSFSFNIKILGFWFV